MKLLRKGSALILTTVILVAVSLLASALGIYAVAEAKMVSSINSVNQEKYNISQEFHKNYKLLITGDSFTSDDGIEITLSFENTTSISYVLDSYETEAAKLDDNNFVISLKKEKYFYQRSIFYSDGFYSLNNKEVFLTNA